MVKITFVSPPDSWLLAGGDRPALALPSLAAYIRQFGHEVKCQDLNHTKLDVSDNPDIVAVSCTTPHYSEAVKISNKVRKISPDSLLLIGGPHATALPKGCLKHFDTVVTGEGEIALKEICDDYKDGEKIEDIKGIVHGKPINNLDSLPFPAWDLLPMEKYFLTIASRKAMHIVTSRGCPYNCIFCCKSIFGYKFRGNSANYLIKELDELIIQYPWFSGFQFPDDTFTIDRQRVIEFCNKIIEKKWDIRFRINTRVDRVDKKLLELLYKAGCRTISYGIESFDQKVLNIIRKGTTVKQNIQALKWTREVGIRANAFMLLGVPGESEESLRKSLELAKKYIDSALWSVLTPYPATYLWNHLDDYDIKINKSLSWDEFRTYDINFVPPITMDIGDLTSKEIYDRARRVRAEWKRFVEMRRFNEINN